MINLFENLFEGFRDIFQPFQGEERFQNQINSIHSNSLYRPGVFERSFLELTKIEDREFSGIRLPKEFNIFLTENPDAKKMDEYHEEKNRKVGYELEGMPVIRHWTTHVLDQEYDSIFIRKEHADKIVKYIKDFVTKKYKQEVDNV